MRGITVYTMADIFDYIHRVIEIIKLSLDKIYTIFLFGLLSHWHYNFLILSYFQHNDREFLLKFSAMEIYNESVRDLLGSDSTPLRLLDDPEVNIVLDESSK